MTKDELKAKLITDGYNVSNVINAWSNGSKIRKYVGQGNGSVWHNPKDGYRKMFAVLIEIESEVSE